MRRTSSLCTITAATTFLAIAATAQQSERKMTARELFYTPVAPKTTPGPPPPHPETSAVKTPPVNTAKTPKKPANTVAAGSTQPKRPVEMPGGGVFQNASKDDGVPLGLRYSVLKLVNDDRFEEVDIDTAFRSGDKIRIAVEANDDGYLYIVQRGTSKTWNLLFPNADTGSGDNRVERGRRYEIPSEDRFSFDGTPGEERVFIVFSRQPEPDLEKLIYDLSAGAATKATPTPASTEKGGTNKLLLASSNITDNEVNGLRNRLISRDLVFEKVSSKRPGSDRTEKAFYVANPDRSSSARLVAEVSLKHR